VQLAVGQARMVIDDTDDHRLALGVASAQGAITGGPVAGLVELGQTQRVDVQQRAGLRPLIAARALTRLLGQPRDAVAPQHLADARPMPAIAEHRQAHLTPAGPGPRLEDLLLLRGAQRPRAAPRDRPARRQTTEVLPRRRRRRVPAVALRLDRGRRAGKRSRDLAQRLAGLTAPDHRDPRRQSELTSTVLHVRPLLR
jgi:hypothetical protein